MSVGLREEVLLECDAIRGQALVGAGPTVRLSREAEKDRIPPRGWEPVDDRL